MASGFAVTAMGLVYSSEGLVGISPLLSGIIGIPVSPYRRRRGKPIAWGAGSSRSGCRRRIAHTGRRNTSGTRASHRLKNEGSRCLRGTEWNRLIHMHHLSLRRAHGERYIPMPRRDYVFVRGYQRCPNDALRREMVEGRAKRRSISFRLDTVAIP